MSILISWLSPLRMICMAIDSIAFNLLDNAYMLVIKLSTAELFQHETIRSITNNLYILFGVVAFFRLALVLVNAIIDPEKLNEKGKGLSNIFFRVVGMIVLLAVTPFLFQLSYDLQKRIVGADPKQNLIFKTLLGDNANIGGEDAGKALRNIALSSLITIDKNYLKADGKICQSESDTNCGFMPLTCVPNGDGTCTNQGGYIFGKNCDWDNCQKAVSRYNEMYVNEDMKIGTLARSVGVSKKIEIDGEKEEVYVYNYMFIITGFVGGFMIYIIISFAIDIAVRMFELFVLEVLSPLFIATFVDPKSAQSGPFKNWLSAVGKSYANLYIKLAILALMILLVALINQSKIFTAMSDLGGWVKIFAVIGLLIFAKKAPKWIMDMIGIKGDGVGLWSPKKLKENMAAGALIGGLASKAGRGLAGVANSTARNLRSASRDRNARKKKALEAKGLGGSRENRRNAWKNAKDADGSTLANWHKNRKQALKDAGVENAFSKDSAKRAWGATAAGIKGGFTAGVKADNLKGALNASTADSNNWKGNTGLSGKTLKEKFEDSANRTYGKTQTWGYGDALQRQEQADKLKKAKFREDMYDRNFVKALSSNLPELDVTKLFDGTGSVLGKSHDIKGVEAKNLPDMLQMNVAQACGYSTKYDKDGTLKFYNKDGTVELDSSKAEAIKSQAKASLSEEGAAKMQSLMNMKTGNVISDFGKNEGNIDAAQQAIKNISDSMKSISSRVSETFAGLSDKIKGAFNIDKATGKIKVDFAGIPGLESLGDLGNKEISSNSDLKTFIEELKESDAFKDGNNEDILNSLTGLSSDASIQQHLNFTKLLGDRNSDLTTYLERQDQMSFAYQWAGYKMIGDDGSILFGDEISIDGKNLLQEELNKVKAVSSDEKVRKQQSQDGRINDLEAAIKKKKEAEGKKD